MKKKFVGLVAQCFIFTALSALMIACAPGSHNYPHEQPLFGNKGICFYNFTTVFQQRIYNVLMDAPHVRSVKRADSLCSRNSDCLCYELRHTGSSESIEAWLIENLRTSDILAFEIKRTGINTMEVWFDNGFK